MSRQTDHVQRKLERGWRRIPVWMSPEDLQRLADLRRFEGQPSDQQAIRNAIAWALAARWVAVDAPYAEVES